MGFVYFCAFQHNTLAVQKKEIMKQLENTDAEERLEIASMEL